jgi:ribosomal protein S18 acetylase RimI-like enzyme
LQREFEILRADLERIDDLEPLWNVLRSHHAAVAPQFGPVRAPEESWRRRRASYRSWLSEPGSFMMIARDGARPVGYAFVRLTRGSETWCTKDQVAEVETLSVLPECRGSGLGSALMEAIYAELRKADIEHVSLAVVAGNSDAARFYERHGFVPKIIHLWRDVPG